MSDFGKHSPIARTQAGRIDTGITLFVKQNHHVSHCVRLAMAYKSLAYELVVVGDEYPEDLADLNPYNCLPTLIDRMLVLYQSRVIIDYIDERFKGVKLLPDAPQSRAEVRQLAWRIENDWLSLADTLFTHPDSMSKSQKQQSREALSDSLTTLSPLFSHQPFFLSDSFGLCDCLLAPMLWRLDEMQVSLPVQHCRAVLNYMERVFSLECFKASLY